MKKKTNEKSLVKELAIISVAGLTALALYLGYDSALLATTLSLIAGLAGYELGKRKGGE